MTNQIHDTGARGTSSLARESRKARFNGSLTDKQRKAAGALRARRPTCVPGTNGIIVPTEAETWHNEITTAVLKLKLNPAQVKTFCDVAGVAD